ncbi:MAG TPA: hypothetical protein VFA27_13905 [Vicinamibacterales bacterium]|nr:hypothetical protein [Vicinamibacterales bacterium]
MFPNRPNSHHPSTLNAATPEAAHRACWYGRRTAELPSDIGCHTIENGELLFCAHPMWFPVVGHQFDVRNCGGCDYFKPSHK